MPTVSVLTTSYNRADFIGEAIESVLASTFTDFEYIIVDDRSTDDTLEIARSYAEKDERIRVYQNEKNLGDYPNRNQAASYATGKYIKYLDSDDIMYAHCLDVMVSAMERFPDAGLGMCSFSEEGSPFPKEVSPRDAYYQNFFERDLFGRAPGSVIIRRDAFEDSGSFSGKRQVGDHELWLKMAHKYSVVKLPRDLVWDRVHEMKESHRDDVIEKERMHLEIRMSALLSASCPLSDSEKKRASRRLHKNYSRMFFRELSRCRFRNAIGATTLMKITKSIPPGAGTN